MVRLTRRQALIGGATGVVVASGGSLGRFAIGDEFEEHVADLLGLDLPVTKELLAGLAEERDDYDLRAAGFAVATTSPYWYLVPGGLRRKAVESFIGPLIDVSQAFVTPYVYLAGRTSGRFVPCGVLRK